MTAVARSRSRGRVLLVSQPGTGGVATCVSMLARAAVTEGYKVRVACAIDSYLARSLAASGVELAQVEMRRSPTPADLLSVARIRAHMKESDLVHLHSSKAGAVGRFAALTLGGRRPALVFTPHSWSWMVGGIGSPVYRLLERQLARVPDVIVASSQGELFEGVSIIGARGSMRLIRNGVDSAAIGPSGPVADRSGAGKLLVCVGRLSHAKGQDILVRTLSLLPSHVRLRLVGDGPDRRALGELAAELGVEDRVEFVGHATDPWQHMRAADIVVSPSRYETLQLSLLEAMACARPIIATRVFGTEELPSGVPVVSPGSVRELADAIRELLRAPESFPPELLARCRRLTETTLSLGRNHQQVFELWDSLLTVPRGNRPIPRMTCAS